MPAAGATYPLPDRALPRTVAYAKALEAFIYDFDDRLRRAQRDDYCGIVCADDLDAPSFIEVGHRRRLGVACGFSEQTPLPDWIISLMRPVDLPELFIGRRGCAGGYQSCCSMTSRDPGRGVDSTSTAAMQPAGIAR
ncbi:hypothetical protein CKO31_15460 [Thiohalocapsa halophila]|uniref:Uncharacterized protein n=1 Tax=Thiohalocapsa halophila TaxID=69359 RepID=A0ABS1CL99_9GAMM|nr:hypothetical protein [Thiohalocapsa halophila]MBK1632111.1 hypothetical protein [Thiohalocapsa halophila]